MENNNNNSESINFIRNIIEDDLNSNKYQRNIHTRFPPEPNGCLHIGHAKSICLNFGIAEQYENATCNLRFDDTNPVKEDTQFVNAIQEDIKWLGFDWGDKIHYTSDYYEKLYNYAICLIKKGKAFVCDLNQEEMREYRGTLTTPGKDSPFKTRSVEENIALFADMRSGKFNDGDKVLRAKIDMTSDNIHMRDPVIYRILKANHHRTGSEWVIYPMYDFAHCISDAIENITHSICTLEFEIHRPLYDWILNELELENQILPQQIEFARLNLTNTVMSKRKLLKLVEENHVDSWDDPRMPTISGMRRRGYTPNAIKSFCEQIGVTKYNSLTDFALLEHCLRNDLNTQAQRKIGVLNPLKVVIDNYDEDKTEEMQAVNNPAVEDSGTRPIVFSKVIYIEKTDFMEDAPRKFFRLSQGREVRLKYAYLATCTNIIKNEEGEVVEVHCEIDPNSRGGKAPDGRKVKGTIHWISEKSAICANIHQYDRLFNSPEPENCEEGKSFIDDLNKDSLTILKNCLIEPSILEMKKEEAFQLERTGYFCIDRKSKKDNVILNRTVAMRDSWGKK